MTYPPVWQPIRTRTLAETGRLLAMCCILSAAGDIAVSMILVTKPAFPPCMVGPCALEAVNEDESSIPGQKPISGLSVAQRTGGGPLARLVVWRLRRRVDARAQAGKGRCVDAPASASTAVQRHHNPRVRGSNPCTATIKLLPPKEMAPWAVSFVGASSCRIAGRRHNYAPLWRFGQQVRCASPEGP